MGESIDELLLYGAEKMQEELLDRGYFSSVMILSENETSQADFHIEVMIGDVVGGNRATRILIGRDVSIFAAKGTILSASADPLADFICVLGDTGSYWGAVFKSEVGLMHDNFEKLAEDISKSFEEIQEEWEERVKDGPQTGKRIEGTSERAKAKWREIPIASWSSDEHEKEIKAFFVESNRKEWYEADALWLNSSSYRSLEDIQSVSSVLASLNQLGRAFLPKLDVGDVHEEARYFVAVTFRRGLEHGRRAPVFFWNDSDIRGATYLSIRDHSTRVAPIEMIHLPSYLSTHKTYLVGDEGFGSHPVVFAFPSTAADGSPLVASLDEEVELHTRIEDHDVLLRFRLRDFEISDVKELQLEVGVENTLDAK